MQYNKGYTKKATKYILHVTHSLKQVPPPPQKQSLSEPWYLQPTMFLFTTLPKAHICIYYSIHILWYVSQFMIYTLYLFT